MTVLRLLPVIAGAGDGMMRTTAKGKIAIDSVNKAWQSPNEPKASAPDAEEPDEAEISDEEEEAWLDPVNASAAASAKEATAARKRLQSSNT